MCIKAEIINSQACLLKQPPLLCGVVLYGRDNSLKLPPFPSGTTLHAGSIAKTAHWAVFYARPSPKGGKVPLQTAPSLKSIIQERTIYA